MNFPTSPTVGQTYALGSKTWVWNGSAWDLQSAAPNNLTLDYVQLNTSATVTDAVGRIRWDADQGTADLGLLGGNIVQRLGQSLVAYVTNAEAVTITKGQAVYLFSATGDRASVKLAYNTGDATSAKTLGLVAEDIAAGASGFVMCQGVAYKMDTSTYTAGDSLYLGATAGALTATKPYAPNHLVYIGTVEKTNAGNGQIYVRVQNGYELDELHNVSAQSPTTGQTIVWNGSTSLWEKNTVSLTAGVNGTLPIANGGTGTATPSLVQGTNVTITGTWPNQTIAASGGGGSGDVVGPASATDNALVRFDTTTGKLVQNSVGILSDTGAISGLTDINASGSVTLSGGTANGVTYLNGSKVLTSGSALTFDGTKLAVLSSSAATLGSFKSTSTTNQSVQLQVLNDNDTPLNIGVWGSSAGSFGILSASTPFMTTNASTLNFANTNASGAFVWGAGSTPSELMRLTSTGLGIGTSSPSVKLHVKAATASADVFYAVNSNNRGLNLNTTASDNLQISHTNSNYNIDYWVSGTGVHTFSTGGSERARIDASGNLLVGTTNTNPGGADINGIAIRPGNFTVISALGTTPFGINRGTDDGTLINLSQAGSTEGTISVSGTTVSYNGGHLSRWAQMLTKPELFKGTVMSNLDEMNVYTKDGQPVDNEQLNKVKVSDTEGDVNVAGVFVNWSHDEDHNVDEINMAMTGDMIIRIAQGVTVVRGDLLMSAGDGTAKPQGDDIVRSKTVAKVTSNHVTCTYADGSYCVPCVLMAC